MKKKLFSLLLAGAVALSWSINYTATTSAELHQRFNLLQAGDTLFITAGTYDSVNLYTQAAGQPGLPIVVKGAGEGVTILDQGYDTTKSIAVGGWKGSLLTIRHARWIIEDLTLQNSFDCVVQFANYVPNCILQHMEWTRYGAYAVKIAVLFWDSVNQVVIPNGADSLLIQDIYAHLDRMPNPYRTGSCNVLDLLGSDDVHIRNNYFVADYVNYVGFVKANSSRCIFENNLCKNGGQTNGYGVGWSFGGGLTGTGRHWFKYDDETWEARDGLVRNNVFVNFADYCVHLNKALNSRIYHNTFVATPGGTLNVLQVRTNSSGADFKNNLMAGSSSPSYSGTSTRTNNVTSSNLLCFENASAEDFRVKSGTSPVNACPALSDVTTDFNGFPRDAQPDAGAFELGSTIGVTLQSAEAPLLMSAWPNPFCGSVPVTLLVTDKKALRVAVYTVDGRLVRSLDTRSVMYGVNTLQWDGKDVNGRAMPGGTYLIKVWGRDKVQTQRVVLIR